MTHSATSFGTTNRRPAVGLRLGAALLGLLVIAVACSDDDDNQAAVSALVPASPVRTPPPAPATTPGTTTVPSTTGAASEPATTSPATMAPPTTPAPTQVPATEQAATAPPEECDSPVGTDVFNAGYPNRMSGLVGSDIRTGSHGCFERLVIELGGEGELPGVRVEYVADPILLSPSDQTADIAGDATLVVSVAAWMPSMEGDGYAGPTDIVPTNVTHIAELRQIENFEGMTAWAIGLDRQRDFEVDFLESPPRIVVDIASG